MVGVFNDKSMDIVILGSLQHSFQIFRIAVTAFDEKCGSFYIIQPINRGTHNMLIFIALIEGKLGVVVIFNLIHGAKAKNGPEFIGIFGG